MVKLRRKRIKAPMKLHNEFTLKVTEYKSEDCKDVAKEWEAKAYNTLLNAGLTKLQAASVRNSTSSGLSAYGIAMNGAIASAIPYYLVTLGGMIRYGSGDTTPAATDTELDVDEGGKLSSSVTSGIDFANLYSYYTQKITITPAEEVGTVFKEVGLASDDNGTGLTTRAIIVDSEGSALSITKTATMQIEIFSKLYWTLDAITFANTEWVNNGNDTNAFLKRFKDNTNLYRVGWSNDSSTYFRVRTGTDDTAIDGENDDSVNTQLYASGDIRAATEGSYGFTITKRLGTTESNGKIKEIGLDNKYSATYYPILRSVMPVTGVFAGTTFTDVEIGTGDGVEDEFTLEETDEQSTVWTWNEINEANPTVKVDGVTQTPVTDFTYNDTTGVITFEAGSIPPSGDAVTASWSVPYLAKSNSYVVDIIFEFTYAEGTVPT